PSASLSLHDALPIFGFAIPSETVKDVVDQLKDGGEVQHAFLGISGATLSPDVADALNLDNKSGVLIQEVTKDGPADKAGIEGGEDRKSTRLNSSHVS